MTKLSDEQAVAKVVDALKDAFPAGVTFELAKESERVYRIKATADTDEPIADGLEKMKLAQLRGSGLGVISDADADEYADRSLYSSDPIARAGYDELADEARGREH
jgi:hypothetical protein